jgi:hypothetical protein
MKSLYAYFGLLDLHNIDSPGHSLYQIGLVDSIREEFNCEKFDFYSYYPEEVIDSIEVKGFPNTPLGQVFLKYRTELFDKPIHNIDEVLRKINEKEYDTLFLKARFRNLSTLAKKWKDAREFEQIIETAFMAGYTKDKIIILDTDLSLPQRFYEEYEKKVTVKIPSIDFPGISSKFLMDCVEVNVANKNYSKLNSVFYGNIDTHKYKPGNEKSEILSSAIGWVSAYHNMITVDENFTLICKPNDCPTNLLKDKTSNVPRNERHMIWETLSESIVMLNITKEKYDSRKFIPARIYEAMIFGMIPISYKFNFLCPSFSFQTIEDLVEVYSYLRSCTAEERIHAYKHFVDSYFNSLLLLSTEDK